MEMTKTKAIVAAAGAFITALQQLLMDNVFDVNDWASLAASIVLMGLTVWGVFQVENKPKNPPVGE